MDAAKSPERFRSIYLKLNSASLAVQVSAFLVVFSAVIWMQASAARSAGEDAVERIRGALMAKGKILVLNNGQALAGMAADNAFVAVADLVSSTVRDDEDVLYGIYMDHDRQPWVYSTDLNPQGHVDGRIRLDDSLSLWAAELKDASQRKLVLGGEEVHEFTAPVKVEGDIVGYVRYGLSTASMRAGIEAAHAAGRRRLLHTIMLLILLGAGGIVLSAMATRIQSRRITRPLEELAEAVDAISKGKYEQPVNVATNDEIGILAGNFEDMRLTVKKYTENLEELVAEKIQELKDILDNIEQGLFTVNLDGTVNPERALRTNTILGIRHASRSSLAELLRLDEDKARAMLEWVQLVKEKQAVWRWSKLIKLVPVRELEIGAGETVRIVQINYQKMFNRQGEFAKIMVLAQDVTLARRIEAQMRDQNARHLSEVKAILGIVNHISEIPGFLEDADARISLIRRWLDPAHLKEDGGLHLAVHADLMRELHTLKGTAATFGFERLSQLSHQAEDNLRLSTKPESLPQGLSETRKTADAMQVALDELKALVEKITGGVLEGMVSIPEARLSRLRRLCAAVEEKGGEKEEPAEWRELLELCRVLDFVPLSGMASKYAELMQRLSIRLGKGISFRAVPEDLEMTPMVLAQFDEPLVHLLKNAADHGIEPQEERVRSGKPAEGSIVLGFSESLEEICVTVEDDGRGIDGDKLVAKAVGIGLKSSEAAARLNEREKIALVLLPGLSTRGEITNISGRGVGMDVVAEWVRSRGGRIDIRSKPGEGTSVSLALPKKRFPKSKGLMSGEQVSFSRRSTGSEGFQE